MAGVNWPARALAIQAMAVEMPIPNLAAADLADRPSRDAARTRLRKSSLKARVILPPTKSPVEAIESEFGSQGNPQRDSAFNGRALDLQGQGSLYSSDMFSDTTNSGLGSNVKGNGYAASLESGYVVDLDESWTITPQAQMMWSSVKLNNFQDAYQSAVSINNDNSLTSRLGLEVGYNNDWTTTAGTPVHASLYGIANVTQDWSGQNSLSISDVKLKTRNDPTWGGVGLGGNLSLDTNYAIYGQGSFDTSLNHPGDSYSLSGTIGLRRWW